MSTFPPETQSRSQYPYQFNHSNTITQSNHIQESKKKKNHTQSNHNQESKTTTQSKPQIAKISSRFRPSITTRNINTHYSVSGGPMIVTLHSKMFESSTSPAENPSTGFFMRSAEIRRRSIVSRWFRWSTRWNPRNPKVSVGLKKDRIRTFELFVKAEASLGRCWHQTIMERAIRDGGERERERELRCVALRCAAFFGLLWLYKWRDMLYI